MTPPELPARWTKDGEHSSGPRVRPGHRREGNLAAAVTEMVGFLRRLAPPAAR